MVYEFGAFRLEPQRRVLADVNGNRVEIAAKAFDALLYLVEHAGTVVTRDELMQALWPRAIVEDNSLNKLIAAVRKALGEQECIATLQGRGYQLVADVRARPETPDAVAEPANDVVAGGVAVPPAVRPPPGSRQLVVGYGLLAVTAVMLVAAFVARDRDGGSPQLAAGRLGPVLRTAAVTAFPGDEYSPTLSPEGSRVAFSWDGRDGNRDIYVTMIDGTGLQRLTQTSEPDSDPAWSPDGRRIAFLRRVTPVQRDIFIVPALGGREQRVHSLYLRTIPDVNVAAPKLAWTDDGQRLLFASGREGLEGTHIYAFAPATGEVMQLTFGDSVYDNSPMLSHDGAWLAFRRDPANPSPVGTLMVQQLGAGLSVIGEPTAVPTETRSIFHSPSWSADGRYLTFVGGPNIFEWERGGASPRQVHNASGVLGGSIPATGEVSRLALAREGASRIGIATRIGTGPDIWGIPLDRHTRMPTGGPEIHFFSSVGEIHPRYSPDGRRVAFVSRRGGTAQLWVAEADGSNPRAITNVDADVVFPNWSPDGERLVFYTSGDNGFQVYVVDANGSPPKHIAPGGGPSWSADGEHLYVTEPGAPFTVTRVRISDRRREPLFTGHLAFESGDGRWLLYWKGQETYVYKRSLVGNVAENPEEPLVNTIVGGIAPVDDGFFYVAATPEGLPRTFSFFEYASSTSRDVAPAPAGTMGVGGLTVSPDGTELLYAAQASESGADLVLLEFGSVRSQ